MQQLRDKLAVAERTAKAEAQLKVRELTYILICLPFSYMLVMVGFIDLLRRNIFFGSKC